MENHWFDLYRGIVMPAHCDIYGHLNVRQYAAFFDDAGWHIPRMAALTLAFNSRIQTLSAANFSA